MPPRYVYQVADWADECRGLDGIGRGLKPFHLIFSAGDYTTVYYRISSDSRKAAKG
ncbi:MAG: hypothetical protein ACP5UI_01410 [Thermoprotei archaeon]